MEVRIISKETVKPSCLISQHPTIHKLSLLDQISHQLYIPLTLFYSSSGDDFSEKSHHLKASLSNTLTHFYPFAGRIKDATCVDCNDEGALYVEAHVAGDMSVLLQEPEMHLLEKLLPCNPHDVSPEISSQVLLAAQVNHFDCGGMAISICIWHGIADGSAAASFLTSWAAVACGVANDFDGVIFDCTSMFPPQDVQEFLLRNLCSDDMLSKTVTKRFVFDSAKVAALIEKVGSGPYLDHPTRFEAITSLIWGVLMAISTEEEEEEEEEDQSTRAVDVAGVAINLRNRMTPPLPKLSIGNIYHSEMVICSKDENVLNYNGLAGKLHDSISKTTNDQVMKIYADDKFFQYMRTMTEEFKNSNLMRMFGFSSWCRFPFYEADFGWGKPLWVATALQVYKIVIFIDTKDGQGIEAWVPLPKEDMVKFEQNPAIRAYASFKPST